jgi:hypothetical protein
VAEGWHTRTISRVRLRLSFGTGVLALLVAGIASAGAPAAAHWSRPRVLDADVGRAVSALGADLGSSQTVAAWAGARGVFAATARVNGRFGVPQRLSGIGVGSDSAEILAANARGDALVLWQRSHPNDLGHGLAGPLFAAYRRAGERFAPARRIAGNALGGMVALDARGNAVIAWDQPSVRGGRPAIDVVDRDADGRYGPVSVIASGAVTLTGLAVDPAGQAVVVWDSGAFPATGIRAATCRPSGQCSAPVPIVPATVGARAGAVGIDHAGRALIAWDGPYDGASSGLPYRHAQVTPLAVGATAPGATQTLPTPTLGRVDSAPQVNVDGAGDAVVAWQNTTRDGRTEKIVVARSTRGHPFARPIAIGTSYFGGNFNSTIGPDGQAAIAWDSLTAPVRAVIAASPTSPFGHAARMTNRRDSAEPALALGPRGRALGIWWDGSTPSALRYARTGAAGS